MNTKGTIDNSEHEFIILTELNEKFIKRYMKENHSFLSFDRKSPVFYNGRINWPIGIRFYMEDGLFMIRHKITEYALCIDLDYEKEESSTSRLILGL